MNMKKATIFKRTLIILTVFLMLTVSVVNPVLGDKTVKTKDGFTKGVSHLPVKPVEKVTMVNYDENSFLDDYAYLASVPTAIFKYDDKLISHPVVYYQDEIDIEEENKSSLNARQGLDYFMEDWMSYCNNKMDKATLINVDKSEIDSSWNANEYKEIQSDDIYELSSELALDEWSYADNAVIAVSDQDVDDETRFINGSLEGALSAKNILVETFDINQVNIITPVFKDFEVPQGYKYLKARLWWPCYYFALNIPGFFNAVNVSIPPGDPNLELFCQYEDKWMQVAATLGWNPKSGMDVDYTASYIYNPGPWRVSMTDVPTHELDEIEEQKHKNIGMFAFGRYGTILEATKNLKDVKYKIDITMFPGVELDLEDKPMYGCTDADFKLTWDNPDANLGFSIIGPAGEEVFSVSEETDNGEQEMYLEGLGECLEDENYKICVFSMNDMSSPVDFEIEYTLRHNLSEDTGNSLTSATEGAILGSVLNAPMLYTSSKELTSSTKDALYKLGVEHIYIVDIGARLKKDALDEIQEIADVEKRYTKLEDVYNKIREETDSNDVIFSTLDPWSYWYVDEKKPHGEYPGALHIGPAAYIAAHHGSPVLIVDNHPELSSAIRYHTEFWNRMASRPASSKGLPSVAEMHITGTRVYDFLDKYGFDEEGEEMMITVAGQYDIGASWDRTFFGKAVPGRFLGSPVDTAYWISRSVFYPALIFVNPATNPDGIELINGSESVRKFPYWSKLGLRITKDSGPERFEYPVLHTYLTYNHRFNERASDYWGWKYTCADGQIPGESPSFEAIDRGVNLKYYGQEGAYYADFTDSETIPLYAGRAGYGNVFSTNTDAVFENINKGVMMWMGTAHGGGAKNGGSIKTWNPDSPLVFEENPWRGYEWYLGSTVEPDTMSIENYGIIPMIFGNPTGKGLTGHGFFRTNLDYGLAKKPVLDGISKLANLPLIKIVAPEWLKNSQDYYDGVVGSTLVGILHQGTMTAYELDDRLENVHSAGFVNGCCLLATKYFHMSLIRHGFVFQVFDPWPTSWFTSWQSDIPRNLALGDTIGEAFVKGISHVGILYLTGQWWADIKQNVCYYGDPALRPLVPGTDYSTENYWEKDETEPLSFSEDVSFDGHMPFGATEYPNEREPKTLFEQHLVLIVVIILIAVIMIALIMTRKKSKK
jgi:hypothetical protein